MDAPLEVPFSDLGRYYNRYGNSIERAVIDTLRSGWWIRGKRVQAFTQEFSDFIGARHCIPVANGTDALELALKTAATSFPAKKEIITVANAGGYASTAIYAAGLIPVYADIDPATQLLSAPSALASITDNTLAVVVTHLYGGLVDVEDLRENFRAAGRNDVLIIEDCAQAHGACLYGKMAGSLGDIAAFSFYPTKNLGAMGDAGAIITSSDELGATARRLHQYGWTSKYTITQAGGRNSRMDEIQAAILSSVLPHLQECNAERASIMARYAEACPAQIQPLLRPSGSVVHLAVFQCKQRDQLRDFLMRRGISSEIHYPILDCDQPGWQSCAFRVTPQGLTQARKSAESLISLPCFIGMTSDEIDHVCKALTDFSHQ
ncbi:DegT/DnrJ/EryC1/StrS family aminotransferase [uncultured Nitratireductor sp.]|uniref:DegT/DnrJ/EryC1/StrS family aminotransferase n=1 Tax=uncultured Nitratireductor sp. TaxID=520953 RepID=UPI002610CC57|nr:DegT/DnrJ/EryC1/StrS family aminotransferase [uncultured Nitratireductor sp.]